MHPLKATDTAQHPHRLDGDLRGRLRLAGVAGECADRIRTGSRVQRVLMISPYPVLPPTAGGKIRTVRLAEELGRRGLQVTVLTPFKPGQAGARGENRFRLRQVKYPFVGPLLLNRRGLPYQYTVSFHPGYGRHLRSWICSFDVVQFEHAAFADLVDLLGPEQPVVYDAHNVEVDYVRAEARRDFVAALSVRRIARLDSKLCTRADLVLSCSSDERERLAGLYGVDCQKIHVIANGIQRVAPELSQRLAAGWPAALGALPRRAVFSGSDVPNSLRAVRTIVHELAPRMRDECGFVIHGSCGRHLSDAGPNVFVDTDWRNFSNYVGDGAIALNPVTVGAGTNLKTVNCLAHGMPLLSTPFGMRGWENLVAHACVRPLEGFETAIRESVFPPAPPPEVLEPYLWSRLAASIDGLYEGLMEPIRLTAPAPQVAGR